MARELDTHKGIIPSIYADAINEVTLSKFGLVQSGAVLQNPVISDLIAGKGNSWHFPIITNPLNSGTAPAVPTSDSSVLGVPEALTSKKQIFIKNGRARSYTVNSMDADYIGSDPMDAVVANLSAAMADWRQRSLQAQLDALLLNTGAVVSGNANKLAAETLAAQTAATKLGTNAIGIILDTINGAWSDYDPQQVTLVMHPDLYTALAKQNTVTTFIPLAQANPLFKNFMGFPVITDVTVGKRAGTGGTGFVYTVYLLRQAGVHFGQATFEPSFEMKREALQGNFAGANIAVMREYFTFHVPGTSFIGTYVGDVPTDAELGTAGNFSLISDRRSIGIAAFTVNL